jgi:hypothetical protein
MTPMTPEKSYGSVLIIWFALVPSTGMFYFIIRTSLQPGTMDPKWPLTYPLLVLAILMVLWSRHYATRYGAREAGPRPLAKVQFGYLLALVMSNSVAVYGLVVFVVAGWPYYWFFFVISAVAFILNFPRRDAFENAGRV